MKGLAPPWLADANGAHITSFSPDCRRHDMEHIISTVNAAPATAALLREALDVLTSYLKCRNYDGSWSPIDLSEVSKKAKALLARARGEGR
jgi:hypothetical protein